MEDADGQVTVQEALRRIVLRVCVKFVFGVVAIANGTDLEWLKVRVRATSQAQVDIDGLSLGEAEEIDENGKGFILTIKHPPSIERTIIEQNSRRQVVRAQCNDSII